MIVRKYDDPYGGHLGERCAYCNRQILEFPFIQWLLNSDSHDLERAGNHLFHPACANKFLLRLARDLHEIDADRSGHTHLRWGRP